LNSNQKKCLVNCYSKVAKLGSILNTDLKTILHKKINQ
jgi:hypothetical protein